MRYAILSDIHSNLEALRAVLDRAASLRPDAILCLGDIVGYNADPNECVDIVRREGMRAVMGNHDSRAAGLEEPDDFNALAERAVLWTRQQLTAENRSFLRSLPRQLAVDDFVIFHGSLHDTDRYIMTKRDVADNFRDLQALPGPPRLGFFGHTHVKLALALRGGAVALQYDELIRLEPDGRHLVNPGSVGQPRDGDPRAAFCLYDTAQQAITFFRVAYDIGACQEKVIRAGLPPRLADRLSLGV